MPITVFIFGNPDLEIDSLPIRILPDLQRAFPAFSFDVKDPNEEWEVPEKLIVIDTAIGLPDVKVFDSIEKFVPAPNLSMHDFDALANLRFLKKLGKLKEIRIIGVPPDMDEKMALDRIKAELAKLEQ